MATYKHKQVTCRCDGYPFPHRQDSKECKALYNSAHDAGYEKDSIESLGLRSLFAPDNSNLEVLT